MQNNKTITQPCPAKINLALSVSQPLPQDSPNKNMHPIASWMVALDFADQLTVTRRDGQLSLFNIEFATPQSPYQPSPASHCEVDWPLSKDLAFRAHQLLEKHLDREMPVIARITKNIPTGAGLAGGSSNAASMFIAINKLFDLNLPTETLISLSTRLGSDIAFLIAAQLGQPSAIVTNLGEKITPAPITSPINLVLIFPPFPCPTQDVYKTFDQNLDNTPQTPDLDTVKLLTTQSPLAPDAPFNDLAAPARKVQPKLAELINQLRNQTNLPFHVSGSGSTIFTITSDSNSANALAQQITTKTNLPAIATKTLD